MATIADRAEYWCNEGNLGYDQYQRWDIRVGGECDCSSLALWCVYEAGYIPKPTWGNSETIASQLAPYGFKKVASDGNPRRNDILVNQKHHVAIALGNGMLAQAGHDERGKYTGGKSGDQGGETVVKAYYNYPWDYYLRPPDSSPSNPKAKQVQEWLNSEYKAGLAVDGECGRLTKAALVKALQTEINAAYGTGLAVDGDFGPLTKAACPVLRQGDKSKLAKVLQAMLLCRGLDTGGFDGEFGPATYKAVLAFQAANKLLQDGEAGPDTLEALSK